MKQHQRLHGPARDLLRKEHKQRGVTLVELMVGITIGLLVSIAAVGTLVFNQISSTTVSDTVRLQQDAATVMRIIGRQLKQAGAVPVVQSIPGKFTYLTTYTGIVVAPPPPSPISINGTNGATDTLTLSYSVSPNGANSVSNCFGQTPDATATNITSTFEVAAGAAFRCRTPVTGATAAQTQPFLDNVEDLQFWYAVRAPGVVPQQIQYRTADTVVDWTFVEAVQVCVRMVGTSLNNPTGAQVTVGCNNENIAADGRIRRVFRQVFTLRNLQTLS